MLASMKLIRSTLCAQQTNERQFCTLKQWHLLKEGMNMVNIASEVLSDIYISQLVRYARICSDKREFKARNKNLSKKLEKQVFKKKILEKTFVKFYRSHYNEVRNYGASVKELKKPWIVWSYWHIVSFSFKCYIYNARSNWFWICFSRASFLFFVVWRVACAVNTGFYGFICWFSLPN